MTTKLMAVVWILELIYEVLYAKVWQCMSMNLLSLRYEKNTMLNWRNTTAMTTKLMAVVWILGLICEAL